MSNYSKRTVTLFFISLFILQILASASVQELDEANVLTLTFDELNKKSTAKEAEPAMTSLVEADKQPQQAKPQYDDDEIDQDEYEDVDITIEEDMLFDDDYINDEALDNPPPPQEIEPFVDEDEVESSAVSIQEASASMYEEDAISANALRVQTSSTRPPLAQVTGCKTQGHIALTYSEGPSDVTAKIVRQLTKADARANFFVNATWLYTQQYAMVLQNIYNAGHFIGMTYRVANDDPTSLSDDDIRTDILNNAHIIETLINVAPKYVRLHYTEEKDVRTEGILRDLGFVIVGYNLDSQDYMKKEATGANSIQEIYSETFKKYKDTYDAKGSFISIQYDLPYTGSLNAVSHIINTIDEEGYTMVRLDGCLNDPKPYKRFANSTEYVGDKFSFEQPGYHQGQKSIVLDATDAADIEEDEFKIQGLQTSQATQSTPLLTAILCIIGAVFTLFL
ncbi:hypothetical protein BD408DRAFT_381470 [Parasitella parasitica]|nr:hypothetical protein BD408DRAFT_381470 [Parasitella parasitica]